MQGNRFAARFDWRLLVACAAVLALFSLPSSAAFFPPDPNSIIPRSQSIESKTTFDLFENDYDEALEARRPRTSRTTVRGGCRSGTSVPRTRSQLLHYAPAGPGYYTFRINYGASEFENTAGQQRRRGQPAGHQRSPGLHADLLRGGAVPREREPQDRGDVRRHLPGYGWQLGGGPLNHSIGIAIDYFTSTEETTGAASFDADPRPGEGDDVDFNLNIQEEEKLDVFTLLGEYMAKGNTSTGVPACSSSRSTTS